MQATINKLLLFIFLSILAATSAAQEAKVLSLSADLMDLTASRNPRNDLNGTPCGLVKVKLPVSGVTFEGDVIGNVSFNQSEYLVYMSPGKKMLKINIPSYKPLMVSFSSYGIDRLESKTVYVLDIETGTLADKYPVRINISTPISTLLLGSDEYSVTTGKWESRLSPGEYPYTILADNHKPKNGILYVRNPTMNEIDVLLKRTSESSLSSGNNSSTTTAYQPSPAPATPADNSNGHQYVDLGLPSGLKWATCNVGASRPEDYGSYFAWGETQTKSSYDEKNSQTYKKKLKWLKSNGYIDSSGNLTMAHDAARRNWGGSWRMPTKAEIEELIANTTTEWTTQNGVKGRLVKSKRNGNSIFLPAAGYRRRTSLNSTGEYGHCWSASPNESDSDLAYGLDFGSGYFGWHWSSRYYGFSVRPVTE